MIASDMKLIDQGVENRLRWEVPELMRRLARLCWPAARLNVRIADVPEPRRCRRGAYLRRAKKKEGEAVRSGDVSLKRTRHSPPTPSGI